MTGEQRFRQVLYFVVEAHQDAVVAAEAVVATEPAQIRLEAIGAYADALARELRAVRLLRLAGSGTRR